MTTGREHSRFSNSSAALVVDDLSWSCCGSVLNDTRSARYDGQRLCRICYISDAMILNLTRYLTGSRYSCHRAGLVCDRRSKLSNNRAAVLCTHCSGSCVHAGRPARTEFILFSVIYFCLLMYQIKQ